MPRGAQEHYTEVIKALLTPTLMQRVLEIAAAEKRTNSDLVRIVLERYVRDYGQQEEDEDVTENVI